ncbi:mechanosensitive ion channel family protein [Helicobacter sp. 23-1048]
MKKIKIVVLSLFLAFGGVSAEANITKNEPQQPNQNQDNKLFISEQDLEKTLKQTSQALEAKSINNAWFKQYSNIKTYNMLESDIAQIERSIKEAKEKRDVSKINQLKGTLTTIQKQREILRVYADNPYAQLLEPPEIKDEPHITNPILIVSGYLFIKELKENQHTLTQSEESLQELLNLVLLEFDTLSSLKLITKDVSKQREYENASNEIEQMIQSLQSAQMIFKTSNTVYFKNIEDVIMRLNSEIKAQFIKMIYIGVSIAFIFIIAFFVKVALRKYITDSKRIYTASKIINFFNLSLVGLIFLFAYLENVTYAVAIVGFASAGLAIAMKDLFMSLLGWFVIVLGGSVHVGDRVKVIKDGAIYVGDVLDISALRITIYEDVTLTSYLQNRRAGRIIFIPNNYIFTTLLANYTHAGIKTVWDGVDFSITFDSNHKKALKIATEIAKKYSKGYTEVTKKRMEHIKDRFSLRNMNLEARAYCMIEPNGIRISLWYQANAYSTLGIRSAISTEVIEAILQEDDIHIAYPTTKVVPTGSDGRGNKPFYEPLNLSEAKKKRKRGAPEPIDERKDDSSIYGV